jgi:hypothetical protein
MLCRAILIVAACLLACSVPAIGQQTSANSSSGQFRPNEIAGGFSLIREDNEPEDCDIEPPLK